MSPIWFETEVFGLRLVDGRVLRQQCCSNLLFQRLMFLAIRRLSGCQSKSQRNAKCYSKPGEQVLM